MWLLQERYPDGQFTRSQLEAAIIVICGVHPSTVRYNKAGLFKIGWLKHDNYKVRITDMWKTQDVATDFD